MRPDADDRDRNRVDFKALTLESIIDALSDAGALEIAATLWRRYCDFERIYHFALHEFAETVELPPSTDNYSGASTDPKGETPKAIRKDVRPAITGSITKTVAKPAVAKKNRRGRAS